MQHLNYITADEWWDTDITILPDLVKKFEVYVYVLSPAPSRSKFPIKSVEGVKSLYNCNFHFRKRNPLSCFFFLMFYFKVLSVAKKKDRVTFMMYGWHPFLIPFFLWLFPRRRIILSAHNYQSHSHSKYDPTPLFYKRYHYFHFHSEIQKDYYVKDYPKGNVFFTKMKPKNFGMPTGKYKLDKAGRRVFLFFGLIRKYKRLDLFIKVANKISHDNVLFLIAGYANDFSKYQQLIGENPKIHCEIRFIENDEIADLFSLADFLVLPYDDATQSGPSMIALNYSLPIIASNQPAFCQLVNDGENGFLFEQGNEDELVKTFMKALSLSDIELSAMRKHQDRKRNEILSECEYAEKFEVFISDMIE